MFYSPIQIVMSSVTLSMTALHQIERLLPELKPADKAQVFQWLARDIGDAFPGIEMSPDVLNGEARIIRTRIPVWTLVQAKLDGMNEADILRSYPMLRAQDLVNAWGYARAHRDEIEQRIAQYEPV
jgi:uncharacterized protein (DUF433 family)